MESVFKYISINKIARYAYPGFLILFMIYAYDVCSLRALITKENPVIIIIFTFTFGAAFYIVYRYTLGELLYLLTNNLHRKFWKETSTLSFLESYVGRKNARRTYNYLRWFFFEEKQKKILDISHTELNLLYMTVVIGMGYFVYLISINAVYQGVTALIVTLVLYFASIYADIKQHEIERRLLENGIHRDKLFNFFKEYGLIKD